MRKLILSTLTGVAVLCFVCLPALAQTTGTIRGQIKDADGGPLPGVTVTATSQGRGTSRTVVSGKTGSFALPSLDVQLYTVNAVLEGFQEQVVENVRVGISSFVTLDLVMALATFEETIQVSGAPVLDTTSSAVGTSFDAEFIEDLPTTRNFWDMMAVAPGVVQQQTNEPWKLSAFGSSTASNSWSIDGSNNTLNESGQAFWWPNADTIEEVQVLAIGAPAQYGNMSGAAMNIVTKSGTNAFKGSANIWYQGDSLTGENATIDGVGFRRDQFADLSVTLGGPIKKDKAWFFLAYEYFRDAYNEVGDPSELPNEIFSDRYDVKLNWAPSDNVSLQAKYHSDIWPWKFSDAFQTASASGTEGDENPAWGASLDWIISNNTFFEISYSGYTGIDVYESRTGSVEDPFIDYSPPEGGPPRYSGGLYFPWSWENRQDAIDVAVSTYADDFLGGDHEFKFGVSYGTGTAESTISGGVRGRYYYRYEYTYDYYGYEYVYDYFYRVTAAAYTYGAENETISAFIDDSWRVTEKLTINVGVRFDQLNSDVPAYPRLDRFGNETGEIIPGIDNQIDWSIFSPRIGFAYKTGENGVLRGFYGKFYNSNVTGDWKAPPPSPPIFFYEISDSLNGPWEPFYTFDYGEPILDPNLQPPETDQFTLGYERRLTNALTINFQGVYKETKNLIGWEILDDGVYEMLPWVNPITGEVQPIASIIVQPTTRKGNRPGDGSLAPPGQDFEQEYKGVSVFLNKRYADGWAMMASYTWSDSNGFLPTPLAQDQGNPAFTIQDGRDPNNWINAEQALQNQRRHALQIQGNFDLPWNLLGTVFYRYLSGKPYNRQVTAGVFSSQFPLNQGGQTVIAVPASEDTRFPDQNVLDLGLGRTFKAGPTAIQIDLQLFNVFNNDAHDSWQTLIVAPGDSYYPRAYVLPRRLGLRFGIRF